MLNQELSLEVLIREITRRTVLVGNGINRSVGVWSWPQVVRELVNDAGLVVDPDDLRHIPLSLVADRVLHRGESAAAGFYRELESHLLELEPTSLHRRLVSGDFPHVLTTNYDFTMEKAAGLTAGECANRGWARESKYSQFRHTRLPNGCAVWHIHGDLNQPSSILLGYSRYAGYLHVIRQTLAEGRNYRGQRIGPWGRLLDASPPLIWPSVFLSHDVLILGLGMDFAEAHLWWLLSYRAEKLDGDRRSERFPTNRIFFVWNRAGKHLRKAQARARQLEAYGVTVIEEDWVGDDWTEGYLDVLDRFSKGRLQ